MLLEVVVEEEAQATAHAQPLEVQEVVVQVEMVRAQLRWLEVQIPAAAAVPAQMKRSL
jgi:hypothetical protein